MQVLKKTSMLNILKTAKAGEQETIDHSQIYDPSIDLLKIILAIYVNKSYDEHI